MQGGNTFEEEDADFSLFDIPPSIYLTNIEEQKV